MAKLYLNPDSIYVKNMVANINKNDFHCPCKIFKDSTTICNFRKLPLPNVIDDDMLCLDGQNNGGACTCGLYRRVD